MNFSKIDAIIFDLGGVIINIDPERTYKAFSELSGYGVEQLKDLFGKSNLWGKFELGEYEVSSFYQLIREAICPDATDSQIEKAWCALLLDIPPERIALLKRLSKY